MPEIQVARQELFATSIWSFDLGFLQDQFAGWIKLIEEWRASEPEPAGRTNRLGWNSHTRLLDMPAFAALDEAARLAFARAFEEMQLSSALRFKLEAWVNLHDRGGYNTAHLHPNRLLSGSFYLQVPEHSGPLVLRDPRPAVLLAAASGTGANCGGLSTVQPKAGQLLVFPNWLEHFVEPHLNDVPRIAIGINAVLV